MAWKQSEGVVRRMAPPMTLHTMKIHELLADGDWHELEVVL